VSTTSSGQIFTKKPFVDTSAARLLKSRLFQDRKRGIFGKDDQLIGAPLDYSDNQLDNHSELIRDHNSFMQKTFPDLLDLVKTYFENFLGKPCFYNPGTSLPGFRIFTIPPVTKRALWFHNDLVNGAIMEQLPDLGVTDSSRLMTFIVLLDDPPGLTSGLLYFPDSALGAKIMSYHVARHSDFEEFARLEIYKPGEINIFEECTHSIYAKNDSTETRERVTLQGHLIETPAGYLIFW
jgi:hypothetical protein